MVFSLLSTLAGVPALSTHLYTDKCLWYFESRVTAAETLLFVSNAISKLQYYVFSVTVYGQKAKLKS